MTLRGGRLDRLAPSLSAKERALLVLRSWKEGRAEEPSWRWTMPQDQVPDFNRLIELMNGVNVHLRPLLVVIHLELDKLRLHLGALAMLTVWHIQAEHVDAYLRFGTKRRSGAVLDLEGSLVYAPSRPVIYLAEDLALEGREPTAIDGVTEHHKEALRTGLLEQEELLRAAELAVAEVGEAFDREDPALPEIRELLDAAAERLTELREQAERYTGPLPAAEPDPSWREKLRRLLSLDAVWSPSPA